MFYYKWKFENLDQKNIVLCKKLGTFQFQIPILFWWLPDMEVEFVLNWNFMIRRFKIKIFLPFPYAQVLRRNLVCDTSKCIDCKCKVISVCYHALHTTPQFLECILLKDNYPLLSEKLLCCQFNLILVVDPSLGEGVVDQPGRRERE